MLTGKEFSRSRTFPNFLISSLSSDIKLIDFCLSYSFAFISETFNDVPVTPYYSCDRVFFEVPMSLRYVSSITWNYSFRYLRGASGIRIEVFAFLRLSYLRK